MLYTASNSADVYCWLTQSSIHQNTPALPFAADAHVLDDGFTHKKINNLAQVHDFLLTTHVIGR